MNAISTIEMYNILKGKLGENEAKSLTEYVESKGERTFEKEKDVLATKEDLANVKSDIIKWMFIFWIGQIAVTLGIVYFRG
ncbi:hypothetical protein [Flavobacterium sp.]|uniref:hypothetical protein n=1 Tax=Flavobacterium sp. TaxID=239 RepID=UPI00286B3294|nr:hypothetical protein [Flavobacterium sp.]